MVVCPVDQPDIEFRVAERLSGIQPSKSPAENQNLRIRHFLFIISTLYNFLRADLRKRSANFSFLTRNSYTQMNGKVGNMPRMRPQFPPAKAAPKQLNLKSLAMQAGIN